MTAAAVPPLLAVEDLAVSFMVAGASHEATRGVAFELRHGRVLALVGESGSGKSVTALAALGLLPDNAQVSGSIRLDGEELVGADPARLRALRGGRIGTVFQEPTSALNPVFTIGDQIGEAIRAHRATGRAALTRRVRELLGVVGLDDPHRVARSYPHELSGGQLQRAMIAMAISGDPVLLIADEPTTALDVTVQAGILDLLRDLRDRLDMSILLITHDMGVVADLADDVVVLSQGRVVERAPVTQLFAAPAHAYTRALLDAVPDLADLRLPGVAVPTEVAGREAAPPATPTPGSAVVRDRRVEPDETRSTPATVLLREVVVDYPGRRGGRVRAVDQVSLRIDSGEVLGLVGESGSGKSTVGRALAGLVPVTAGTVQVAGTDIGRAARHRWRNARLLRRLRAEMGIVFQDPASSLNPRRSIAESIAEPLVLHRDLDAAGLRHRVDELLDAVQLAPALRDRYPYELSGGQRQRVAIARAVALDPALLIADEPTSALDVSVQARVLDLFRSLQRRFGFASLFVSHDLAVVQQLAHRVAVMHRGRIVEQGPTRQVLHTPVHPYTQRLLAAAPVADPRRQADRRRLRATVTAAPIGGPPPG